MAWQFPRPEFSLAAANLSVRFVAVLLGVDKAQLGMFSSAKFLENGFQ